MVTDFATLSDTNHKNLGELLDRVMPAVCNIVLPEYGSELYRFIREERFKNELLFGSVTDGIRASRKGSTEKNTSRVTLFLFLELPGI